jgi:hypothetical protein
MSDLFGNFQQGTKKKKSSSRKTKVEEENLDFDKTYEVPIFDLILGCKIEVS